MEKTSEELKEECRDHGVKRWYCKVGTDSGESGDGRNKTKSWGGMRKEGKKAEQRWEGE